MLRSQNNAGCIPSASDERLHSLLVAAGILAVLALFAMIVGPSVSDDVIGASPSHSHLFLTAEAATLHSHSAGDAEAFEAEVVNLSGHSADSASGAVHIHSDVSFSHIIRLTTTLHLAAGDSEYSDPLLSAPDLPPRLS